MVIRFIGAGLLDGFYTALTTWLSAAYLPTLLDMAAKWSEFASRFFLAFMLCFIGWSIQGAQDVNERFIYFMAAIVSSFVSMSARYPDCLCRSKRRVLFANLLN